MRADRTEAPMPTIDVHAHCVPEALLEAFRRDPGRWA